MIISISGAQSTGKTTLLESLKKIPDLPGFEFVQEIVRTVQKRGFKINEQGDDDTQLEIMSIHLENSKSSKNVILDRCALDCLAYTYYAYDKGKITSETLEKVESIFKEAIKNYDVMFYISPEFEMVEDNVRSTNKEFRDAVVENFEKIIEKYDLKVIRLTGSVEERLNQFMNALRSKH